jgi:hypothetical protein
MFGYVLGWQMRALFQNMTAARSFVENDRLSSFQGAEQMDMHLVFSPLPGFGIFWFRGRVNPTTHRS